LRVRFIDGGYADVEPWIFGRILHNYYNGYMRSVKGADGDLIINDLVVTFRRNRYVHVGPVKFIRDRAMIYETFIKQMYSVVDVRGKTVIDIGAYVGDTAIYFVLRGARKVIALEPNPFAYQEMLENIKLNGLEDKIIPVNAALARKRARRAFVNVMSIRWQAHTTMPKSN
jgi:tRNA/tmRNA/rRNA uracil-C5-methylase (TrmA/RlmC/RlmD family)